MSKLRAAKRKKVRALKAKKQLLKNQEEEVFVPEFDGFMQIFLHDHNLANLISRAMFEGKWDSKRGRWQIFKKPRRYSIRLHIVGVDGSVCGHTVLDFDNKGGERDLSRHIFEKSRDFMLDLIEDGYDVDPIKSYAIVRA